MHDKEGAITRATGDNGQQEAAITAAWNEFVEFLKERKSRITQEREIIFRRVAERRDHFRADELAAELSRGARRVSRGTIYRTLALMLEARVVRAIRDGDKHLHYEYLREEDRHEHMICDRCGAFIEFAAPEIAESIKARCEEHGFDERFHRVAVFGLCRNCKRARKP